MDPLRYDPEAIARHHRDEARTWLSDNNPRPQWWAQKLHDLLGPILPGEMYVVSARPGCGKSTFLLTQVASMMRRGHRVIYMGTEIPGFQVQLRLSAWALGYPPEAVLLGRWDSLGAFARERVERELDRWEHEYSRQVLITAEDSLQPAHIIAWLQTASEEAYDAVIVDHLHEVAWGGDPENPTAGMAHGIRAIRTAAKRYRVPLLVAAQQARNRWDGALEDYVLRGQSAIKTTGAIEEMAQVVLLLHRALRSSASPGDIERVRRQQLDLDAIVEPGTMVAHIAKSRLMGSARDQVVRFYLDSIGRLHDDPAERDRAAAEIFRGHSTQDTAYAPR